MYLLGAWTFVEAYTVGVVCAAYASQGQVGGCMVQYQGTFFCLPLCTVLYLCRLRRLRQPRPGGWVYGTAPWYPFLSFFCVLYLTVIISTLTDNPQVFPERSTMGTAVQIMLQEYIQLLMWKRSRSTTKNTTHVRSHGQCTAVLYITWEKVARKRKRNRKKKKKSSHPCYVAYTCV